MVRVLPETRQDPEADSGSVHKGGGVSVSAAFHSSSRTLPTHRLDINLPTSAFAFVALVFTLTLNPVEKVALRDVIRNFDFLGL